MRNEADTLTKQNTNLQKKLKETTDELNNAQAELAAWDALGIPVDKVKEVIAIAKESQEALEVAVLENEILAKALTKATNELAKFTIEDYKVPLPVGLKGKVLVADPKWEFVVLDIGEDDGVLTDGELLVNRNGRLVAKVRVQSVQKNRSIANLVQGWELGEVSEGDFVIPAL